MKRGHSNVHADRAESWPGVPNCARIPLIGGATAETCRELPALALRRDEWQEIGLLMGWVLPRRARQRKK